MERRLERSPDVERAAQRLSRPLARAGLIAKRTLDVVLALAMLVALLPLFVLVWGILAYAGEGFIEQRTRLGRHGRPAVLTPLRELPAGAFGGQLERLGAPGRPLLMAVLRGRLSFVGPSVVAPGTSSGHT